MSGAGPFRSLQMGTVLSTEDPEARGRLEVEIPATGLTLWAPVVTLGAGAGYGVAMLPRTGETVAVAFAGPDEEHALVLGAVWSGGDAQPSEARPVEDVYAVVTPGGSRIEIDESESAVIELTTPSGAVVRIDDGAQEVTVSRDGESVTLSPATVRIESSATVEVSATNVNVSASMVQVDAAMSNFSGVVKCDTLIATSVVGTTYTPGAGNIW